MVNPSKISYDTSCMNATETQKPVATVSDINNYLQIILEDDPNLSDVWVTGELLNVKYYERGGILYFTLTDGEAQLSCVMFSTFMKALKFEPKNGLKVVVRGKLKVFNKRGTYSLQVAYMTPEGEGQLSKQLEALKKQLLSEGLFDEDRKKALPKFPESIGLITGLDSAAMWDFVKLTSEHVPHLSLTIVPATMQGPQSSTSIRSALSRAEGQGFDVVVVLRGGGSAEDLAWFNDEALVRRIAAFDTPLISAIGHEVDVTLSDFVSDFRASTPSAAVQALADPFKQYIHQLTSRLEAAETQLTHTLNSAEDALYRNLDAAQLILTDKLDDITEHFDRLMISAERANPLHKFRQGFSITQTKDGEIIKSIEQVSESDSLTLRLQDGFITSTVTGKESDALL